MSKFVLALDFGTDSIRALLVNAHSGEEIANSVRYYPRWMERRFCDAQKSQFRHHPLDYIESMESAVKELLVGVSADTKDSITAISIDTTGSTPVAINEQGVPLALLPDFSDNPDAMFILWKDHSANTEADEINALCKKWDTDYSAFSGGTYSSEWFWSKILHQVRKNNNVSKTAYSWLELCDWIPALLTGNNNAATIKRSRCAAGHKAMWNEAFGGLPSESFLNVLDERLSGLRAKLYSETYTSDEIAGNISAYWSDQFGLRKDVLVGVGGIDAHFGAVGACIEPETMVKVIGTSTCDMLVVPPADQDQKIVRGISGQVDGSIIPGMLGMEAGQSAFGDLYDWFRKLLEFPMRELMGDMITAEQAEKISSSILPILSMKASALPVSENDMIALDWINGRRTPYADLNLKGAIHGIHLGSDASQIFKALVEATAFGSKSIITCLNEQSIGVNRVVAVGGIAKKSPYVMQTLANVLNMPIAVVTSDQACALGGAMFAATISGIYPNIHEAQQKMSSGYDVTYSPEKEKAHVYEVLYTKYNAFGAGAKI